MRKKLLTAVMVLFALIICLLPTINVESIINYTKNDNTMPQNKENLNLVSDICATSKPEDSYVYLGGKPIGIVIGAGGLIVLGSSDVNTQSGIVNPAADSGIARGDVITHINGNPVNNVFQLRKEVGDSNGAVKLTVKRGNKTFDCAITPVCDKYSGAKRIGIITKEDIGGVGTLTFVTDDGKYAALGHHIADAESGLGEALNTGSIFNVEIEDVIKGERGKAGGLCASVNRLQTPIGNISKNTNIGLYGDFTAKPEGQKIKIAAKGEAKMGRAQVLTTVNGSEPKFYDIDIVKVISQNTSGEKGMVIAVRDAELLEKTGGIVQGMSGSPIVQNGKLIGAVTHVFISDPTRGYAVHSRFMYEKATENPLPSSLITVSLHR